MTAKANEQIVNRHGDFVWYELMTTDAEASKTFFGGLLGWSFITETMDDMEYTLFSAANGPIGGLFELSEEMAAGGGRPLWAGYIAVDDVDKTVDAITDQGGAVLMAAVDLPDVGRIAFVADPQGAPFYVMKPASDAPASPSFAAYEPRDGHCAWNKLVTADPAAAKSWYGKLFGLIEKEAMDMGPMGEYCIMQNAGQDFAFGAVMKKPDQMPVSLWIYYFRVPDIDVAAEYVPANGGQVIMEPMEIPGGDFVIQGMDPQGALFALIGKRT